MYEQRLLLHGFIRIESMKGGLSLSSLNLNSKDVINLCDKFYTVDVYSYMDETSDELLSNGDIEWLDDEEEIQDLKLLQRVCKVLYHEEQYYIAYRICTALIKAQESLSMKPVNTSIAVSHYALAAILWAWQDYNSADCSERIIREYKKAIEISDEDFHICVYNLGLFYKDVCGAGVEVGQFLDAIQMDSSIADYYAECGLCWIELNDFESAELYLYAALDLDPCNPLFNRYYAKVLLKMKDDHSNIEECTRYYRNAIDYEEDEDFVLDHLYEYGTLMRDCNVKDHQDLAWYYLRANIHRLQCNREQFEAVFSFYTMIAL